jgi:glycosyltransferase involved in cell wall biosynthesis
MSGEESPTRALTQTSCLMTPPAKARFRPVPTLVSVVIPVRNQARVLPAQLRALAGQTYSGAWELIIVDGASTDDSEKAVTDWRRPDVQVSVIRTRRGLNHQRGAGARSAKGELIAFCDADDVASPGWLDGLVAAAGRADIVGGALELDRLNGPVRSWRDDVAPCRLEVQHDFLAVVPGGNCAVWADVAQALGWDESFTFGSSDIEFSWRAQLQSYRLAFAHGAVMHVRHRHTLRGLAGQWYRYGESGGRLYLAFRHAGMPRADWRQSLAEWRWLLMSLPRLARPGGERAKWVRMAAFRCGRLVGGLRAGVVFP